MRDKDVQVMLLISGGFALAGCILLAAAGYLAIRNLDYSRNGIPTAGRIEHRWSSTSRSTRVGQTNSRSTGTSKTTYCLVSFFSSDGQRQSFVEKIHGWGLREGEEVTVLYKKRDPEKAQIKYWGRWVVPLMLSTMAAGFALPLIVVVYFELAGRVRQRESAASCTRARIRPHRANLQGRRN